MVSQYIGVPITFWVLWVVAGCFVCGRYYARLFVRHNKPKEDHLGDAFVLIAWLSFFSLCIVTQLFYGTGFFDPANGYQDNNATSHQLKLSYVSETMVWPCLYFVKFAMLCFFDGVISRELFPRTWVAVRVIALICLGGYFYSEGTTIFWCWPVSLNWNVNSDCETRSDPSNIQTQWALHMITDMLVYSLGFALLKEMRNLPLREKLGAGCMFALGFVGIIVSSIAFWVPSEFSTAYYYRAIEQCSLICITCIPSLRILFSRVWGRRKKELESNYTNGSMGSGSRMNRSHMNGSGIGGLANIDDLDLMVHDDKMLTNVLTREVDGESSRNPSVQSI